MTILDAIFQAVAGFFKNLPILDKWFTKAPSEKKEGDVKDVRDRHDTFKKGPPK